MKKNNLRIILFTILSISFFGHSFAQYNSQYITGHFNGSYENISQYYLKDNKIEAIPPPDKFASNGFLKLDYNYGDFSAGIQYETYMPAIYGYFPDGTPTQANNKIANKYFKYTQKKFAVQVGDFYEQFGSGLIYRSFENRQIGINNAMEGFNVYVEPADFMKVKVIYGRVREIFDYSKALTRGLDAEINLISMLKINEKENTPAISIGGSFVSKYEEYTGPIDNFPTTVNAVATRLDFSTNNFSLNAEFVNKGKDPSTLNYNSFAKGKALQINTSFTKNNFGATINLRSISNINFKSERLGEISTVGPINYIPSLTKQHDNLTSNIYVYSAQPKGEIGGQTDVYYTFKSGSKIGGKYGLTIAANLSYFKSPKDSVSLLGIGKDKYFSDANIEVRKKWSKKIEANFSFQNIFYNNDLTHSFSDSVAKANVISTSVIYKFSAKKSIRIKLENLFSKNNQGNWASALTEFSFSSPFAFFASDLYNYGKTKNHYYNVGASVTRKSSRFSFAYGKQRAGLFCVGGVCRFVPANYGFTATLTTSFAN